MPDNPDSFVPFGFVPVSGVVTVYKSSLTSSNLEVDERASPPLCQPHWQLDLLAEQPGLLFS